MPARTGAPELHVNDLKAATTPHLSASVCSRVGCAGWSIATPLADEFPSVGSHLERYGRVLNAAEINSSFYRPHQPKTYARWADSVPPAFRFSVKLPRTITHDQRLIDSDALLAKFADEVGALGEKLGCILVQLPPSLQFDPAVAQPFFLALRHIFTACSVACEARHPTWFAAPATALLQGHGIIRVIADPAVGQPGPHVPTSADVYLRLHGSPRRYYSTYSADYLAQLTKDIEECIDAGRDVWCIFDNTAGGAALPNALSLMRGLHRACELVSSSATVSR